MSRRVGFYRFFHFLEPLFFVSVIVAGIIVFRKCIWTFGIMEHLEREIFKFDKEIENGKLLFIKNIVYRLETYHNRISFL